MENIKGRKIDELFNILVQFEKIGKEDSVTEETYRAYLDRLKTWFVGFGDEEIVCALDGLRQLGAGAEQPTVKRAVFHMISVLDKDWGDAHVV